jgi:hypothetical protein
LRLDEMVNEWTTPRCWLGASVGSVSYGVIGVVVGKCGGLTGR